MCCKFTERWECKWSSLIKQCSILFNTWLRKSLKWSLKLQSHWFLMLCSVLTCTFKYSSAHVHVIKLRTIEASSGNTHPLWGGTAHSVGPGAIMASPSRLQGSPFIPSIFLLPPPDPHARRAVSHTSPFALSRFCPYLDMFYFRRHRLCPVVEPAGTGRARVGAAALAPHSASAGSDQTRGWRDGVLEAFFAGNTANLRTLLQVTVWVFSRWGGNDKFHIHLRGGLPGAALLVVST